MSEPCSAMIAVLSSPAKALDYCQSAAKDLLKPKLHGLSAGEVSLRKAPHKGDAVAFQLTDRFKFCMDGMIVLLPERQLPVVKAVQFTAAIRHTGFIEQFN